MATTLRLILVALLIVIINNSANKAGTPLPRPDGHTLIALAIFGGCIFVAWSLDSAAESLKGLTTAWREFTETVKSMKKSNGEK